MFYCFYRRRQTKKFDYYLDEEEKTKSESGWCYNTLKLVHKNLSKTAMFLAILNMSMGVFYGVFEWYWVLIWFCYLGAFVALYLLLEARRYFDKKDSTAASSNVSKSEKTEDDEYEDGYDCNLSKMGSTQQLRPAVSEDERTTNRETFQMEPIRYTQNTINGSLRDKNNQNVKSSPTTPPPPYFNRGGKHQSVSTINLDLSTSPHLASKKTPSQTALLSYSQNQTNNSNRDASFCYENKSLSTTPRKNINNQDKVQNANQVYSIQQSVSPSSSFKLYKAETNNNPNSNNASNRIYESRPPNPPPQRSMNNINSYNNNNNNTNYKINNNFRY